MSNHSLPTCNLFMVRPSLFYQNKQTSLNNYYQKPSTLSQKETTLLAQREFDNFVNVLEINGLFITVISSRDDTPDAIFPNNWVSFHCDGTAVLYPMFAQNRRLERNKTIFETLKKKGFRIEKILDFTASEQKRRFLEGTGSMVLDRLFRKAYCAISPRTDKTIALQFCKNLSYTPVFFRANQTVKGRRLPIYHTNVMMSITSKIALVCLTSIDDKNERKNLLHHLQLNGKEVIPLSEEDIKNFAGNVLEVRGKSERLLVMSSQAYKQLSNTQKKKIETHLSILHTPLNTIESCGGGSARCMMTEVYLPKNK